jgi:hypothetical protein
VPLKVTREKQPSRHFLSDGESEDEESSDCMSHSQALTCIDSLLHYMEQRDYDYNEVITVKKSTVR